MIKTIVSLIILTGIIYSQEIIPTVPDKPRVVKQFKAYKNKVPTEFKSMEIKLVYTNYPDIPTSYAMQYKILVYDENNRLMGGGNFTGNLIIHMTDAEIQTIKDFMTAMANKAKLIIQ